MRQQQFSVDFHSRATRLAVGVSLVLALAFIAAPPFTPAQTIGQTASQPPWTDAAQYSPACCDPTTEPGLTGQQVCTGGHACCGDGSWRCHDAAGVSSCTTPGESCAIACCDPFSEPGAYGNPLCIEGHACCGDGQWRCNAGNGQPTCALLSAACPDCCDPSAVPACIVGARCCASGQWSCNAGDGSSTCNVDGIVCPQQCCDPADDPNGGGSGSTSVCVAGSSCCSTGRYQCNDGAGVSTCDHDGVVCADCCDPFARPGSFGNPTCIEGTTCCADGSWSCNDATGQSTCLLDGVPCDLSCCDPALEPGPFDCPFDHTCCTDGNWRCNTPSGPQCAEGVSCEVQCCDPAAEPSCIEGATCCSDGDWRCNQGNGQSSCPVDGGACRFCCDPTEEPGSGTNPTCFEGATCCSDGSWQCNAGDGSSTCRVDGLSCTDCCDPLLEPGHFGNPICIEGATCCGDGTWQCNQANGTPSCDLIGAACDAPCCERADRPNDPGNPYCSTGFECCGDGDWQCNDVEGNPTCPFNELGAECPVVCGGILGLPCDNDEFCKLDPGQCCCDFQGICEEIPQACPDVWDPVCGCDGVTYGNACEADAAGVSIDFIGPCAQSCGGITGLECPDGEYCRFPDGQCCCDFIGECQEIPQACPDVCDPVCGCDGESYTNRCEAAAAGVSVEHPGVCNEGGGLVSGVHFDAQANLAWRPTPGAVAYNVYRQRHFPTPSPPQEGWICYASNVTTLRIPIPGDPGVRVSWWFQVAAVFADGSEGPLGMLEDCSRRVPTQSCAGSIGTNP